MEGLVLGYVVSHKKCIVKKKSWCSLQSFCADLNAREQLKLCSYWVGRALASFTLCAIQKHSMMPLCNFMWSATM